MYGAMRTRAPASTPAANKVAGVVMAGVITLAAGYGIANGVSRDFMEALTGPTTIATLPDDTPPPPEDTPTFETTLNAPEAPLLEPMLPEFPVPADPLLTVKQTDNPPPPIDPGASIAPPKRMPVQAMPRLSSKDKPVYPATALRNNWEGVTGLRVCVDARGRVTAQSIASSSGHSVLDEAALDWVRGARFTPGTVDGAAQAMCGASVIYEWRINGK